MAGDKTYFAPTPLRAMRPLTYFNKERRRDEELTALDLRVLMCIGWHDRLSSPKGSSGCYASNSLMAAECGCTITSISRSISHLVSAGLIDRDNGGVPGKRHLTVYRLRYDNSDKETLAQLGKDHLSNRAKDEATAAKDHLSNRANDETTEGSKSFAQDVGHRPETLVRDCQENDGISKTSLSQEISLSEGIDSAEAGKINSPEGARLAARDRLLEVDLKLSHEANLAMLGRALSHGSPVARVNWYTFLIVVGECRDDLHHQVFRLQESLAETMTSGQVKTAVAEAEKALAALNNVVPISDERSNKREDIEGSEAEALSPPRSWSAPAGVRFQVWKDFLTNRRRKNLPLTGTTWKAFNDDLARVSAQTSIPPPELVERCAAKGWGAVYDPREQHERAQPVGKSAAAFAALDLDDSRPF